MTVTITTHGLDRMLVAWIGILGNTPGHGDGLETIAHVAAAKTLSIAHIGENSEEIVAAACVESIVVFHEQPTVIFVFGPLVSGDPFAFEAVLHVEMNVASHSLDE